MNVVDSSWEEWWDDVKLVTHFRVSLSKHDMTRMSPDRLQLLEAAKQAIAFALDGDVTGPMVVADVETVKGSSFVYDDVTFGYDPDAKLLGVEFLVAGDEEAEESV